MTTPPSIESRLAAIEEAVARLSAEVSAIRAEVRRPTERARPGPPPQRSPAPPRPRVTPSIDFERLLGRYGMLGIAVFAAVGAVGTFLSWAISRGYFVLGPAARVLLGLAFAIGLGIWGARLRRTERSFGSSILGLSMVIVLVCAYAAGPAFSLVPGWVAFAGAAVVSWTLALFARRENDEPLWCVAFGGASLAPFVTGERDGSLYALLTYGLLVLLTGCYAIKDREWPVAWRVFYLASGLFAIGGAFLALSYGTRGVLATFSLPILVAAGGVLPFAAEAYKRGALRWLAILALSTTLAADSHTNADAWQLGGAFVLGTALWLIVIDRLSGIRQSSILPGNADRITSLEWIDAAVVPLLMVLRSASSLERVVSPEVVYAVSAAMVGLYTWRRVPSASRDAGAFATVLIGIGVVIEAPLGQPLGLVAAFLLLALASLAMHWPKPSVSWVAMGVALLAMAAGLSMTALVDRTMYQQLPFVTEASATALAVTVALIVVARYWLTLYDARRQTVDGAPRRTTGIGSTLRIATTAPWVWAFVWGLVELAWAFSPSTSQLLLVTYFAATAVTSVAVGHWRHAKRLRRVGLGLALAAAGTAVYGASTYFDIAARIIAYLVTSAFLLGIAYWYRRRGAA